LVMMGWDNHLGMMRLFPKQSIIGLTMPVITKRKRGRIPLTPAKPKSTRLDEAYERLGVTSAEVSKQPLISTIIKVLDGGSNKAIEYLRGSHEADARKFLDVYDSLPNSTRIILPIEAFSLAAGLTTRRVLELITGACFEQSANVAELISRSARPRLVKVAVDQALVPENFDERKLVLQHEGYAPIPKTQVVNVQGDVNTDNRIQSVSINELSAAEKTMSRINDRFNERIGIGPVVEMIPENVESNGEGENEEEER
jgi:hypothetical protein